MGKTAKALGAWALMRGNMPMPSYPPNAEMFANVNKQRYSPGAGPDSYKQGPEYHRWQNYYRSLFPAGTTSRSVREVEQHYPAANKDGLDSLQRQSVNHQYGKKGGWTPQRQALHDHIVQQFRGNVPPAPQKFSVYFETARIGREYDTENEAVAEHDRMVAAGHDPEKLAYGPSSRQQIYTLMGGGPASGKSSIIDAGMVKLPEHHVAIDADAIKGRLPEYNTMIMHGDDRAANYVHEESSHLGEMISNDSLAAGQNVLLDGTGNNSVESVMKKVAKARAAGCAVKAEYVTCDTEEAVRRAVKRAKETGRKVPEHIIRKTHEGVSKVLPELVKLGAFDNVNLWDTQNKTDGKPTLVMSAKGKEMIVHRPELWEQFLRKAPGYKPQGAPQQAQAAAPTATPASAPAPDRRGLPYQPKQAPAAAAPAPAASAPGQTGTRVSPAAGASAVVDAYNNAGVHGSKGDYAPIEKALAHLDDMGKQELLEAFKGMGGVVSPDTPGAKLRQMVAQRIKDRWGSSAKANRIERNPFKSKGMLPTEGSY